jgi:flagellar hook capping protein FlgD
VPRVLSAALLLILLGSTAVAFAVTEGLKLEPSPIRSVAVDKVLSPTCACPTDRAHVAFRLRKADRVTLEIVDAHEHVVQTLIDSRAHRKGWVRAAWNGRDVFGGVVRDGSYRPRVHLRKQHKTIVLPNPIAVDTKPPAFRSVRVVPRVVPPGKHAAIVYRLSEPAHVIVRVNGRRTVVGRFARPSSKLDWHPGDVRPGVYVLSVVARDPAGNRSTPVRAGTVVVPVRLATKRVRVSAGASFTVRVATNGRKYQWKLGHRHGHSRARVLRLVAPSAPGRYTLTIAQLRAKSAAAVFVK